MAFPCYVCCFLMLLLITEILCQTMINNNPLMSKIWLIAWINWACWTVPWRRGSEWTRVSQVWRWCCRRWSSCTGHSEPPPGGESRSEMWDETKLSRISPAPLQTRRPLFQRMKQTLEMLRGKRLVEWDKMLRQWRLWRSSISFHQLLENP